ncbi:MAG: AAA family ATPase [Gemmataceae bacterium]
MDQARKTTADHLRERSCANSRGATHDVGDLEPTPHEMEEYRRREADSLARYRPGDALEPLPPASSQRPPNQMDPADWRWSPIDSQTLATTDYRPTWLIKRLMVAGQPTVLGGPMKSLKTSIAIDLAVSLASGAPFLGAFDVYKPQRVAVLSGESGPFTLKETANRVCATRGLALAAMPIVWMFKLPALADPSHRLRLRDGLAADGIGVLIVDPLYLTLLAGSTGIEAANLFQMGPLLRSVADACLEAKTTPVLVHHCNRPATRKVEPLGLEDLAFAGCAEFARQWLLINRREPHAPGQPARLRLAAGGSCGQSGLWAVTIDEGTLGEDFQGRTWEVTVQTATDADEEAILTRKAQAEDRQRQSERDEETRFLRALDTLTKDSGTQGEGVTLGRIRDCVQPGFSGEKARRVLDRLVKEGVVEEVKSGRGTRVVRRVPFDE